MSQTLDQQIQQYLTKLGSNEKRSLLGIIKSFISLQEKQQYTSALDYNDTLMQELDNRAEALENGTIKGTTWKDVKRKSQLK